MDSGSVIVTAVAVDAESFVTVISYPIRSPALTGDWSATFVIAMCVQGDTAQDLPTVDDVRWAFTPPGCAPVTWPPALPAEGPASSDATTSPERACGHGQSDEQLPRAAAT